MQFKQVVISIAVMMVPGVAVASGFALNTQSGSGLGNAYAGGTAGADDASTIFFNPAGMARLHGKQLALAGTLIGVSTQFADTGSASATGGRALGSVSDGGRKWAAIPVGYFVTEIRPKLHFGIGINAPFASTTEYRADWIGRYQAIKSSIATINVNPSMSYQLSDAFSVGVGLDYQQIKASLTNATILVPGVPAFDGLATLDGSNAAWGYNFGGLMQLDEGARVGLSYRSAVQHQLTGTAYIASALSVPGTTNVYIPITADIKTPDTLSVGYFNALDDKWDVMADLARTGWSSFKELRVVQASTGATISLSPKNWRNTWRVALGVNHHYDEKWTARAGLAYDQSPVPEAYRDARMPDSDRAWLSLGGQYKLDKKSTVDLGYAHLFVRNRVISRNSGGVNVASTALYAQVSGNFDTTADVLSVQYSYGF